MWTSGTTHRYSFDVTGYAPESYYLYVKVTPQPFNPRLVVPVRCGSVYDFDVDDS